MGRSSDPEDDPDSESSVEEASPEARLRPRPPRRREAVVARRLRRRRVSVEDVWAGGMGPAGPAGPVGAGPGRAVPVPATAGFRTDWKDAREQSYVEPPKAWSRGHPRAARILAQGGWGGCGGWEWGGGGGTGLAAGWGGAGRARPRAETLWRVGAGRPALL